LFGRPTRAGRRASGPFWIALIAAIGLGVGGYMKNQDSEDAITGPSLPPTAV
jgi:hypothetical protein